MVFDIHISIVHVMVLWTVLAHCVYFGVCQPDIILEVDEETVHNEPTKIYTVKPDDIQPNKKFSLLHQRDEALKYFYINETTGSIYTKTLLDRDRLCSKSKLCCPSENKCVIGLKVVINTLNREGKVDSIDSLNLAVRVKDINDNSPKFSRSFALIDVRESISLDTDIKLEPAVDLDEGRNSIQEYRLSEDSVPFRLVSTYVESPRVAPILRIKSALDREQRDTYHFYLIAIDGGSKKGRQNITIRVVDENDNGPVFLETSYKTTISESKSLQHNNKPIIKLLVKDNDLFPFNITTISIDSKGSLDVDDTFEIINSAVHLKKPLDYEQNTDFSFRVIAKDAKSDSLPRATADVYITVENVNDEPPEIYVHYINAEKRAIVKENQTTEVPFAYISVKNPEASAHPITCSLNPQNEKYHFTPGRKTNEYNLAATKSIDRELSSVDKLTIECINHGAPPLTSSAVIHVTVLDINDNAPTITSDIKASVREEDPPGTQVMKVVATDPDYGRAGRVTYSLVTHQDIFRINPVTGVIVTNARIDREKFAQPIQYYHVGVLVSDNGEKPQSASTTITVHVLDVNDHEPNFVPKIISYTVRENGKPNERIGQLIVDDKDDRGKLKVKISRKYRQLPFKVIQEDGSFFLITTRPLDCESKRQYDFDVIATDNVDRRSGGTPKTGSGQVTITVEDVNDNEPKIIFPSPHNKLKYNVSFRESVAHQIVHIIAEDGDADNVNKASTFTIADGSEWFAINSVGDITLRKTLTREDIGPKRAKLIVRNNARPFWSASTVFTIVIDGSSPQPSEHDLPFDNEDDTRKPNSNSDLNTLMILLLVIFFVLIIVMVVVYVKYSRRGEQWMGCCVRDSKFDDVVVSPPGCTEDAAKDFLRGEGTMDAAYTKIASAYSGTAHCGDSTSSYGAKPTSRRRDDSYSYEQQPSFHAYQTLCRNLQAEHQSLSGWDTVQGRKRSAAVPPAVTTATAAPAKYRYNSDSNLNRPPTTRQPAEGEHLDMHAMNDGAANSNGYDDLVSSPLHGGPSTIVTTGRHRPFIGGKHALDKSYHTSVKNVFNGEPAEPYTTTFSPVQASFV